MDVHKEKAVHTRMHSRIWSISVQGQEEAPASREYNFMDFLSCKYFGILLNPGSTYWVYPVVKVFYAVSKFTEVENATADKDHRKSLGCWRTMLDTSLVRSIGSQLWT